MSRLMALDIGVKTIGVALSDETQTIASPHKTLWRQAGKRKDAQALSDLISQHQVSALIVGIPLQFDGTLGAQALFVQDFVATLRNYIRIPIHFQDESLSTWEAEQPLIELGRTRQERKEIIDSLAASLILQRWLEIQSAPTAQEDQ